MKKSVLFTPSEIQEKISSVIRNFKENKISLEGESLNDILLYVGDLLQEELPKMMNDY